MRIHRAKSQLRGGSGDSSESQTTLNGVPREPASLVNEDCLYELCAGCGNFFYDRKTLRLHERVHKQSHTPSKPPQQDPDKSSSSPAAKRRFLECLNLRAAGAGEAAIEGNLGRRIPELDPVCSYQAWQLVTRGCVVEVTDKSLGWEERLVDAEVAFAREKGEYVPLKQEKRKRQLDSSQRKKKKGAQDVVINGGSGGISHQQGDSRNSRTLLNGLSPETFGILQKKKVKDVLTKNRKYMSNCTLQSTDTKPYLCEHCDFHTSDPSSFTSHMHKQHKDVRDAHHHILGAIMEEPSHGAPKASGYVEYLRLKSTLLSQPYTNPYDAIIYASLLNLSAPPDGQDEDGGVNPVAAASEGQLVRHQCPFCSHTTHYLEVLWIHQRVAHRVDSGSSLAPKWAPCVTGFKGPKAAGRRTGPPPFLEGKDCPALSVPRAQRTQAPGSTATHPSGGGTKRPKTHTSSTTTTSQPNTSQAMVLLPQEGLGFILARNHGWADHTSHLTPDRTHLHPQPHPHPHSRPRDPPAALKGQDLWSVTNMFGAEGSSGYLAPTTTLGHGKRESTAVNSRDTPMDMGILGLLKNYSPHELAALYQHWGFVDPRLDPQGKEGLSVG
ncbi:unnamed protein product [Oncorhynchus mykiss]|uniref:C2H2-type domain-containing protein n=1 Tax=Oncorhynchus mykiss TaxID=8022 RepID=A0A060Y5X1_ONCMY|nr:unnamed protein product [Oncorhynchus mykiss]